MTLDDLINDLEVQGFKGERETHDEEDYYIFGISLNEGQIDVYALARIEDGVIYISTINLLKDIDQENIASYMKLNDLIITGKLFLSNDVDQNQNTFVIDYGFEILEEYYSPEMLSHYIDLMFSNLENLVFTQIN